MTKLRFFTKTFLILIISFSLTSCNTEERKIKKALKEYALKNGSNYKLKDYRISETITKSNLNDSIKNRETSIQVEKQMMKLDSTLLNKYIAEKEKCEIQKRNTLSYLASTYNSLIRDWQKMIDEQNEKLNLKQEKIDALREEISGLESMIQNAKEPIIYLVIQHRYILDEKHLENNVFLTTEYETLELQ